MSTWFFFFFFGHDIEWLIYRVALIWIIGKITQWEDASPCWDSSKTTNSHNSSKLTVYILILDQIQSANVLRQLISFLIIFIFIFVAHCGLIIELLCLCDSTWPLPPKRVDQVEKHLRKGNDFGVGVPIISKGHLPF